MRINSISKRLMTAVGFVREGARFADVGTDHGYLPIYLSKKGIVESAVASDINEGPLESARKNIRENGVEDKVVTVLSDGLLGLREYAPTDIAIFGMGGELVCRIIEESPWVKKDGIRLILQPMTKQAEMREYLLDHGFSIVDEALSLDEGKIYQTVCAEYSGNVGVYGELELMLGKINIERGEPLFYELVEKKIEMYSLRLDGLRKAGLGDEEDRILCMLKEILKEKRI